MSERAGLPDLIPELISRARSITAITDRVFAARVIRFDSNDNTQLMPLIFASKQCEQMDSIVALVEAGQDRDGMLIARSMIEGFAQLAWAMSDPERIERWFWFVVVEDWRNILRREEIGLPVDHADRSRILGAVREHGAPYLKLKWTGDLNAPGEPPSSAFQSDWSPTSVEAMLTAFGAEELYQDFYRVASAQMHWSVRSLGLALHEGPTGPIGYNRTDKESAGQALIIGINSLLPTLGIMDGRFRLGLRVELNAHSSWLRSVLKTAE